MSPVQDAITPTDSPVSNAQRESASFRDPSGFIFRRDGVVYRQINSSYADNYQRLMSSGLCAHLAKMGLLLPHDEVETEPAAPGYKIIRPRQLDFISYPYEWCFSQLKDAALLTLRIHESALKHGMVLKDASAYNVQFDCGKPVFIDTLSFDERRPGEAWIAYGQFCRHFLAPLALMARSDFRLGQLLRVHVDGIPLDLASKLLPLRSRLTLGLGLHIHAHAAAQRRHADHGATSAPPKPPAMSPRALEHLVQNLISTVEALDWNPGKTEWRDYYEKNNNYGDAGLEQKDKALRELLINFEAKTIWDLGGNTGRFSRVASREGSSVVCWDIDPACVEANYRHVKAHSETNILPLLLDLTNPTPAIGWDNTERQSFAQRGPADLVLALGLVHHMAISNNVPLELVARTLAQLSHALVIEFVPKEDSQVTRLLATREDIFPNYHREGFERAFAGAFEIERSMDIPGTVRRLYLMRSKVTR